MNLQFLNSDHLVLQIPSLRRSDLDLTGFPLGETIWRFLVPDALVRMLLRRQQADLDTSQEDPGSSRVLDDRVRTVVSSKYRVGDTSLLIDYTRVDRRDGTFLEIVGHLKDVDRLLIRKVTVPITFEPPRRRKTV